MTAPEAWPRLGRDSGYETLAENGRLTLAPWKVTVTVPRIDFPRTVAGKSQVQPARPLLKPLLRTGSGFPASVAEQAIVPCVSAADVSLLVTCIATVNGLPAVGFETRTLAAFNESGLAAGAGAAGPLTAVSEVGAPICGQTDWTLKVPPPFTGYGEAIVKLKTATAAGARLTRMTQTRSGSLLRGTERRIRGR